MEQKFNNNRLDLQVLREFCEREGEEISYRKGDQLEREGDPARWFAFVTEGCFKYVKYGVSDDKAHITWFSFEGEFVCDYPTFLYGRPAQATIEAMVPSRILRVTGQQLELFFNQNMETMKLRAMIGEHILSQFRSRYLDLHCSTPRERYEMLLQRCPGIMEFLDLQDIASFLNVHLYSKSKNSVPLIHTTNLQKGKLVKLKRIIPGQNILVNGNGVVIPRVCNPNPNKIVLLDEKTIYALSDCVIVLHTPTQNDAERLRDGIIEHWCDFVGVYKGTGAQYTTLERLKTLLGIS